MNCKKNIIVHILAYILAVGLSGCVTAPRPTIHRQIGESLVCIGEEPAALAWLPVRDQPFRVRNTYLPDTNTIDYVQGRDYEVNWSNGTLRRTPGSQIPDYHTNSLYGKLNFDHSLFPGFGNHGFFVFVDYSYINTDVWPVQKRQIQFLKKTRSRLKSGKPVKIIAFGDSITAGSDVSKPEYIFWNRWAEELRRKYPRADISVENGATGGDNTAHGLLRLKTKVLDQHPDLVLIGFGMNDHNIRGVPTPQFEQNLKQMIALIHSETQAEIILYSTFPPNPRWKFGSHHMADYAAATQRVARETRCAYADVYDNWQTLTARKKPEDVLANNVNHPSDFGHWIYFRVLCSLGL